MLYVIPAEKASRHRQFCANAAAVLTAFDPGSWCYADSDRGLPDRYALVL